MLRDKVESPILRNRLWLVKNHVPFDVAFSLDDEDALAYGIIFGIFEGNEWDHDNGCWKPKD